MSITTRRINAPAATIEAMLEAPEAVVGRLRATSQRTGANGSARALASLREAALAHAREENVPAERTRPLRRLANWIGWDQAFAAWNASYERQADL
jgi:hypothetical protein